MKKTYLILTFLLTLVGCTSLLDETTNLDKDCIVLNIYNGPMSTKATPTNPGAEYERQIKRLDCFFYVKGALDKCVYYKRVDNGSSVIGSQVVPFYVDESVISTIFPESAEQCDVFVIANYPGDDDWEATYKTTSVASLQNIVLDLFEKEADGTTYKHDSYNKPFVMSGLDIAIKGDNNNASGTIPMVRAASKISIRVKMPEWIEVTETTGDSSAEGTTTTTTKVKYYPHLDNDSDGKVPLRTSFHHGVSKTYLDADYKNLLVEKDYFYTDLMTYKTPGFVGSDDENAPGYYVCEIEVPFYSYARTWAKGANDAPYLTLQMPWKKIVDGEVVMDTYYYQILVNAGGLALNPNTWYDMTVNVGVLGSLTESLPTEIKSDDITYYILDWTKEPSQSEGDRYEDVVIKEYAYLMVPENRIVINNSNVGYIPYDASHPITVSFDSSSKTDEILKTTTTQSAFYIDGKNIALKDTPSKPTFNTTEKPGYIKYTYDIPEKVYSPVYVYITISMTVGDRTFSEKVTIVQYPPMYLIPDWSTRRSIFVNGVKHTESEDSKNVTYNNHKLGNAAGIRDKGNTSNYPMYVINVTSFKPENTFIGPKINADGSLVTPIENNTANYKYIIGDPRQLDSDIELDYDNSYTMAQHWDDEAYSIVGKDDEGNIIYEYGTRALENYFPTMSTGNSFQVVAPKFRIVSFNNASRKLTTAHGAAMRCATLQEDGYPAGRWRLPTIAEIQFIIMLQQDGAIQDIFASSSSLYATASYGNNAKTTRVTLTLGGGNNDSDKDGYAFATPTDGISVRCVYDDWYWGSEREAKENTNWNGNESTGNVDQYYFTWGDEPRR